MTPNPKISVIIPTMWMANDYFIEMISYMIVADAVGEIIIIDNNKASRPDLDLSHEKIRLIEPESNLYYNRSMNLGAQEAKYEILCLQNDDVVFHPAVYGALAGTFADGILAPDEVKKTIGMIHSHPKYFNVQEDNLTLLSTASLEECLKPLDGYGACMFVLKEHYIPIPEELVQHFGDVWYYKSQIHAGRKNYWLHNWVVHTMMRVTTEKVPEAQEKILHDWKIAHEVFEKHGIELHDHSKDSPVFRSGLLQQF